MRIHETYLRPTRRATSEDRNRRADEVAILLFPARLAPRPKNQEGGGPLAALRATPRATEPAGPKGVTVVTAGV